MYTEFVGETLDLRVLKVNVLVTRMSRWISNSGFIDDLEVRWTLFR